MFLRRKTRGAQMRKVAKLLMAAVAVVAAGVQNRADAGFIGAPQALRGVIQHIKFDSPTLPPMAYTQFCLRYVNECKPHRMMFRGGRLKLTAERWADLRDVNHAVNAEIRP